MPKLLFLTPYPIESASERYRIYQFIPYLEQAGLTCVVRPFATPALFRAIQEERSRSAIFDFLACCLRRVADLSKLHDFDAVVIHREAFPFFCPVVEKAVLRWNTKVVFSFDDAIHVGHQELDRHKYSWLYKLKYGPGINEILKTCRHIVAGSCVLAEHALQLNPHVTVIPTVADLRQYSIEPRPFIDEPITIGWMGSRSTSPYLLQIEPALQHLSQVYGHKLRFRLYGHPRRSLDLPNFESLPFHLESEIDDLRSLDIGLMPVVDNEWTRGKCAFKAIQYMALGIPVVASPVGMATEVIEDGVNGFLARTVEEWFEALQKLICDTCVRRRMGIQARKTVEARYSLQRWGPFFADLLRDIVAEQTPVIADGEVAIASSRQCGMWHSDAGSSSRRSRSDISEDGEIDAE